MLDVGDRLAVALLQPGELRLDVTLRAIEIVGEGAQTLVDTPLDLGEGGREHLAGAALASGELAALSVRELPLFSCERRNRLGALASEHTPDLLRVPRGFLL